MPEREDACRDAHRRLTDGLDLPPELADVVTSYPPAWVPDLFAEVVAGAVAFERLRVYGQALGLTGDEIDVHVARAQDALRSGASLDDALGRERASMFNGEGSDA